MRAFNPFAASTFYFNQWRTYLSRAVNYPELEDFFRHQAVYANAQFVIWQALEVQKEKSK